MDVEERQREPQKSVVWSREQMVDKGLPVLEAKRRGLKSGPEWQCTGRIQKGSLPGD